MKAKLVPLYFKSGMDEDFKKQLLNLKNLLFDVAEIIEPVALGEKLPERAERAGSFQKKYSGCRRWRTRGSSGPVCRWRRTLFHKKILRSR